MKFSEQELVKLEKELAKKQKECENLKDELAKFKNNSNPTEDRKLLSESQKWADLIFDSTSDLMFLMAIEPDGVFRTLDVNKAYVNATKIDKDKLVGKTLYEVLPKEAADFALIKYNEVVNSKTKKVYVEDAQLNDIHIVVETTLSPIFDEKNEVAFLLGVARDITEKKQAEIVLEKSESKYKQLFENANDAIILFEPVTEIVLEVNTKACEIYGFTKEEFIGLNLKTITKDISTGESKVQQTLIENININFESVQYSKSGKEIVFLINASVIEFNGTKAILSINRDITNIINYQERVVNIANNIPNGAVFQYTVDNDHNIVEVNFMSDGSKEMFGHRPDEIINDPLIAYKVIHPADLAGFLEELAYARVYNNDFNYVYRMRVKNKLKWVLTRSKQTKLANGLTQWDGITFDITSEKLNEIELTESRRFLDTIINNLPGYIYRVKVDEDATPEFISDGIYKITGYTSTELMDKSIYFRNLVINEDIEIVKNNYKISLDKKIPYENYFRIITKDNELKWLWERGEGIWDEKGVLIGCEGFITDITQEKELLLKEKIRTEVLELLSKGSPQKEILGTLLSNLQQYEDNNIYSILLKDNATNTLYNEFKVEGFTEEFSDLLHSIPIQEGLYTCSTSAYRGERVIVSDISTHPNWENCKDIAARSGLAACWSEPIKSSNGNVLGTFAIYKRIPVEPTQHELEMISQMAELVSIVLEKNEIESLRKNSEDLLENIFTIAPVPMFLSTLKEGRIMKINQALLNILSAEKDDYIGKVSPDFYVDKNQRNYLMQKLKEETKVTNYEVKFRDLNGKILDILASIEIVEHNNEAMLLSSFLDVTGSKRHNEILKQSNSLLSATLNSTADGILAIDTNGNISSYNNKFLDLWDYSEDEFNSFTHKSLLLQSILSKIINSDEYIENSKNFENMLDKEVTDVVELKSGKILERYSIPQIIDGIIVGRVQSYRDITEKTKNIKELKESLSLLTGTLNSTADGIVAVDMNRKVTSFNNRALELWGYTQSEIMELNSDNGKINVKDNIFQSIISKVVNKEDFASALQRPYDNNNQEYFDIIKLNDGKILERYTIPQVIDSEIIGRVSSYRDITERYELINEIKKANELLEETGELARVGAWELSLLDNSLTWSRITKEIHEVDQNYMPNLDTAINFYKEGIDREVISKAVTEAIQFGTPWNLELQIVTAKGNIKWVNAEGRPDYSDGKCTRLYGVFQDINERKLIEIALKESEEQYRILFEENPFMNFTLDINGKILSVNRKGISELGYEKEELINISVYDIFHYEDKEIVQDQINNCIKNKGTSFSGKFRKVNKNKEIIWVSESIYAFTNSNSEILLNVVCENITDKIETELALQTSEANLKTIFDNTQIGYVLFNEKANIISFNKPANEFTLREHKKELSIGENLLIYVNKDRQDFVKTMLSRILEGENIEYERNHIGELGKDFWYEVKYAPIKNNELRVVGFVMAMKNISNFKNIELALNDTLKQIEKYNVQLEDTIKEKDKFFSIIAHDLRSPFSGFIGLTELMTNEIYNLSLEELKSLIQELNNSANNLFKLLENLLEWSRLQRGMTKVKKEPFLLNEIISKNCEIMKTKADLKEIKLINHLSTEIIINADQQMLNVIIRNLVSNAIKFTNNNGKIEITAKVKDNFIEICVEDNGIGIPDFIKSQLFVLGSKTSRNGTNNEPSSGLGLLLCKEYVDRHNGTIWVESIEEKGTKFYFTIQNND